jgi:hypothetical protein
MALPSKPSLRDTFAKKQSTETPAPTVTASVAEPKPAATAKTIATNNAKQTKVSEQNRSVPQTVSHHAKVTKRNSVVSQPVANTKPAIFITPQDKGNTRQSLTTPQGKLRVKASGKTLQAAPQILAGETVTHSVGTLLAGKTVRIQFQVTINVPYEGGDFISNQGTVSGDGFTEVLTDDPAVGGAADPTLTPVFATPTVSVGDAQANEPPTGTAPMLFTISLNAPAPVGALPSWCRGRWFPPYPPGAWSYWHSWWLVPGPWHFPRARRTRCRSISRFIRIPLP